MLRVALGRLQECSRTRFSRLHLNKEVSIPSTDEKLIKANVGGWGGGRERGWNGVGGRQAHTSENISDSRTEMRAFYIKSC